MAVLQAPGVVEAGGIFLFVGSAVVVAGGEMVAGAGQDHYLDVVIRHGLLKGAIQLLEQHGGLRVAIARTIERDARDAVELFVEQLRVRHRASYMVRFKAKWAAPISGACGLSATLTSIPRSTPLMRPLSAKACMNLPLRSTAISRGAIPPAMNTPPSAMHRSAALPASAP